MKQALLLGALFCAGAGMEGAAAQPSREGALPPGPRVRLEALGVVRRPAFGGLEAPPGSALDLVQLRWRNLIPFRPVEGRPMPVAWQAESLARQLYLRREGLFLAPVWEEALGRPGCLPDGLFLPAQGAEAAGVAAFLAPAGAGRPEAVLFLDPQGGDLLLPLPGAGPPPPEPAARASGRNQMVELRVTGWEALPAGEAVRLGLSVPAGTAPLALRVAGQALPWSPGPGQAPVRALAALPEMALTVLLVAAGDRPCLPLYPNDRKTVEGWPVWGPEHRLLPGWLDHGVLLFAAPAAGPGLRLELHLPPARLPGGEPFRPDPIALELEAAPPAPPAAPLGVIADGQIEIRVAAVARAGSAGRPAVAVEVVVAAGPGGETPLFAARDRLRLVDEGGAELDAEPAVGEPPELLYVPAGSRRRITLGFALPERGARLCLRYSGFNRGGEAALPNPWGPAAPGPAASGPAAAGSAPPLHPEPAPRGLAGAGVEPGAVAAALDRGGAFLAAARREEGFRNHLDPLVVLALHHAGELPRHPELAAAAREFLWRWRPAMVYDLALALMAMAEIDPAGFRPRIETLAAVLVEGQGADGGWGYLKEPLAGLAAGSPPAAAAAGRLRVCGSAPIPGWRGEPGPASLRLERRAPWRAGEADHSCSQYAVLGLRAAAAAGVAAPRETWARAARFFLAGRAPGKGWGYLPGDGPSGSMTTAGLAVLALAGHFLGEMPAEAAAALREGADWLGRNFSVERNPGRDGYRFYYLYGLERAGRLLAKEFFGAAEWYPAGAARLLASQREDGSWVEDSAIPEPLVDTAFALLFLARSTAALAGETGGEGRLEVHAPPGRGGGGRLLLILDASGSMSAALGGGETRFAAARRLAGQTLAAAGAGVQVGLRVYGHRHLPTGPEADEDTELLVPLGPPDRPELAEALAGLRCRGKTPLTRSLEAAREDLAGEGGEGSRVVLLTDGLESDRRARPEAAAASLAAAGIRLDVVGLALGDPAAEGALARLAAAGGGTYYSATDAQALAAALGSAVRRTAAFAVLDADGRRVGSGAAGGALSLPPGRYTIEVDLPGGPERAAAWVRAGRTTAVHVRP